MPARDLIGQRSRNTATTITVVQNPTDRVVRVLHVEREAAEPGACGVEATERCLQPLPDTTQCAHTILWRRNRVERAVTARESARFPKTLSGGRGPGVDDRVEVTDPHGS